MHSPWPTPMSPPGSSAPPRFPLPSARCCRRELHRIDPREALTQESLLVDDPVTRDLLGERENLLVNRYPDWSFDADACRARLRRQFGVANLKGFGLTERSPEIVSAGVLLEYLGTYGASGPSGISRRSAVYADRSYVELDEASQRNLELLTNLQDGSRKYTLLEVLDQTRTSPGARMLRRWILTPLKDKEAIERRLSAVDSLYRDQVLLSRLRESLGGVLDLERLDRARRHGARPREGPPCGRLNAEVGARGPGASHQGQFGARRCADLADPHRAARRADDARWWTSSTGRSATSRPPSSRRAT